MPDADTQVKVTKTCPTCRRELHLVQDNTGSGWYHATSVQDYLCYQQGGGDGAPAASPINAQCRYCGGAIMRLTEQDNWGHVYDAINCTARFPAPVRA